jgi:DhnA family fructose-bisphosphate aldolase class Ia
MSAKGLRMRRLFGADGRLLLVAMDHAAFMGPVPGLDLPTTAACVGAGADAVMTTYGTARRASQEPTHLLHRGSREHAPRRRRCDCTGGHPGR